MDIRAEDKSPTPGLELSAISHDFGGTRALTGVNLSLGTGVVGLLGPNGAGKSTLLNIASTTLAPRSGVVTVAGHDPSGRAGREAARKVLGYLPQRFNLMSWATCRRNVMYAAWAQGIEPKECAMRAGAALDVVGLLDSSERRARTLSGGQRQRLGIACAIVHDPRVLLLDEPTVGLDPVQRAEIRDYLRLIGDGRTVIVSTHIVEDLDKIAARTLILDHGRIIFDGSRAEMLALAQDAGNPAPTLEEAYVALMRSSQSEAAR